MNNQPLLSICLPTYNQPQDFKRTLLSIISQIDSENAKEIEIIVGDNSTNLETEELVKKEFKLPYLDYYRHGENLGIDKNILFLLEKARGKYVWFFGDDEMKPGTINYILNVIKEHPNLSLIWINYEILDKKISSLPFRVLEQDLILKDGSQVLEKIRIGLCFISAVIMKREKLLQIDKQNLEKFIGTEWMCVYLSLFVLSRGGMFLITADSFVIAHSTTREKLRYDYFKIVNTNLNSVILNFQDKFSKTSIKLCQKEVFQTVWRDIFVGWIRGYNIPKGKLNKLFQFYWKLPEFWLIVPLFFMPKPMIEFIYWFYKRILRRPTYNIGGRKINA